MLNLVGHVWTVLTRRIDTFLLVVSLAIVGVGLITLFSATDQSLPRLSNQAASLAFSLLLMWIFANIPPQTLARAAVPLYLVAIVMLVGVALFGTVVNGSRRWLSLGFTRIQPSEMMKIAVPLLLASREF